jgi:hypothetical protein
VTFLRVPLAAVAALACFGLINPASAGAIGNLDIQNCTGGAFLWSAANIVWLPPGAADALTGCIDTDPGTNVTYSGGSLFRGVVGNILDLTLGGGSENDFMTFAGTTLDFVLTGLGPGSGNTTCSGLAVLATCSVAADDPFVLTNEGGGVTGLSLTAFGTILDGGDTNVWSITFDSASPFTAAEIQSTILGSGTVSGTYAGIGTVSAATATPEPSTVLMMVMMSGAGFLLVCLKRPQPVFVNCTIKYSFKPASLATLR